MLNEVKAAVDFIRHIISLTGIIPQFQIDSLTEYLEKVLQTKFDNHWFPNKPFQGSAFRCIRITQRHMDNEVEKAANFANIELSVLRRALPQELTMWIDPEDVSYRIGEEGSICQVFPSSNEEEDEYDESQEILLNKSCHSEVPKHNLVAPSTGSPYTQCWS